MPNILITGSNSFIGNNFRKFSKYKDVKFVSLRYILPDQINFEEIDVVLHLAAIVHSVQKADCGEYYRVNRDLTLAVARSAKKAGVKQFIFLSTVKVYGDFPTGSYPFQEDSLCTPTDHYGKSKYEAELGLKKLECKDFAVSIIRTPIVYGDLTKANMFKLIRLVDRFPILPFAHSENKRCYTYIENLVGFIDRIIELGITGTFITKDNNSLSTTDLVSHLAYYLGKNPILFRWPEYLIRLGIRYLPEYFERLYGSFELNNSFTKNSLDYDPPFSTEDGISKMIANYKMSYQKS